MDAQELLELVQENQIAIALALAVLLISVLLASRTSRGPKPFLDPQQFKPLELTRIDQLTHNTKRFLFSLPEPKMRLGLPTGQHITFLAKDADGKDVYRPYTPVTDDDTLGAVEFVIKIYPHGKLTQIMDKMKVGDTMLMKGPRGRFQYARNMKRAIGMIAGGTGVTPMYQVAAAILKDPKDTTKISLIFGNLTADDILIKQELDDLTASHPDRFSVYHVLNTPPENWTGGSGFISKDMIQQRLAPPAADVMVLSCGPKPMCDAMKGYLDDLGYTEDSQFQF
eukprot:GHUV01005198.1.p1 GENE.GHUV01005198.1~~GHUV01005198.1.p1  ORF type:complete len:307 (+),score=67.97 GHUV01005198.1:76-921(+)